MAQINNIAIDEELLAQILNNGIVDNIEDITYWYSHEKEYNFGFYPAKVGITFGQNAYLTKSDFLKLGRYFDRHFHVHSILSNTSFFSGTAVLYSNITVYLIVQ